MPTVVFVTVLVLGAALALRVGLGQWAERVEEQVGGGDLSWAVHRLRRASRGWALVAVVVGAAAGSTVFAAAVARHGQQDHRVPPPHLLVGVGAGLLCYLAPVLAVAGAVRPALSRLRDVPLRPPGRARRAVAVAVVIGLYEVVFQVGIALSFRHGGARPIGLFVPYAMAFLLLQTIAPLEARLSGPRRLTPEQEARTQALAADTGLRHPRYSSPPASPRWPHPLTRGCSPHRVPRRRRVHDTGPAEGPDTFLVSPVQRRRPDASGCHLQLL